MTHRVFVLSFSSLLSWFVVVHFKPSITQMTRFSHKWFRLFCYLLRQNIRCYHRELSLDTWFVSSLNFDLFLWISSGSSWASDLSLILVMNTIPRRGLHTNRSHNPESLFQGQDRRDAFFDRLISTTSGVPLGNLWWEFCQVCWPHSFFQFDPNSSPFAIRRLRRTKGKHTNQHSNECKHKISALFEIKCELLATDRTNWCLQLMALGLFCRIHTRYPQTNGSTQKPSSCPLLNFRTDTLCSSFINPLIAFVRILFKAEITVDEPFTIPEEQESQTEVILLRRTRCLSQVSLQGQNHHGQVTRHTWKELPTNKESRLLQAFFKPKIFVKAPKKVDKTLSISEQVILWQAVCDPSLHDFWLLWASHSTPKSAWNTWKYCVYLKEM